MSPPLRPSISAHLLPPIRSSPAKPLSPVCSCRPSNLPNTLDLSASKSFAALPSLHRSLDFSCQIPPSPSLPSSHLHTAIQISFCFFTQLLVVLPFPPPTSLYSLPAFHFFTAPFSLPSIQQHNLLPLFTATQ